MLRTLTLSVRVGGKRARAGVVADDRRGGQDAGHHRHHHQDDDEHQSLGPAVTLALEEFTDRAKRFRRSLDRAVGVVHLREGVPGGGPHAGHVPATPGLDEGVDPDHQAREQNARHDDQVAQSEAGLDVRGGQQHRLAGLQEGRLSIEGAEQQDDQVAVGEAARRHDPAHPGHEAGEPAHFLRLDPHEADGPGVPPRNREVDGPHDRDQKPRNLVQVLSLRATFPMG